MQRPEFFAFRRHIGGRNCSLLSNAREADLSISERFIPLVRTIDLVLAEQRQFEAAGPSLTIWHRFQEPAIIGCKPGEEILMLALNALGREVPIRLSLATKIVIDYTARHLHVPQNASQIEAGIRSNPFYLAYGSNAKIVVRRIPKICRSVVRVYVARFRRALALAASDAGIMLDPSRVLISETTDGNEILYRLRARVEWRHIPLQ
jgi:hypothetical protein